MDSISAVIKSMLGIVRDNLGAWLLEDLPSAIVAMSTISQIRGSEDEKTGLEVTIDDMSLSNWSHDTVKSSLLGLLLVSQRSSKLVVPNLPLRI